MPTSPEVLRPFADDARRLLDDQDAAEVAAGIEKGHLPDYIPFLIARQEDRAACERIFGAATANVVDNPFFVRPRNTPDFATFKRVMRERGIEPETNIWRLIEKRGRASLRAQEKKAIDDAITAVHGVKAPAREVPEVAGVAAKLECEQASHGARRPSRRLRAPGRRRGGTSGGGRCSRRPPGRDANR